MARGRELGYDINASAMEMAQEIFGDGVTVVRASYSGDRDSSAIYSRGDSRAPEVTPGDTGVILSTGNARDFTNSNGNANQSTSTSTNTSGVDNDSDFNAAAGSNTYDAAFLEIDFIPATSLLTMQFVFSSEEYPEFQNSVYQDFVGVWVNGTQVDMVVGNGDVDPGNLNDVSNQNLFIDNTGSDYNTEMDGFTVTMTLTMNVIPGVENSIKIGIADVVDSNYDSNLLIAGDSVQSDFVAQSDTLTMHPNATRNLDVLDNDVSASGGTLTITHINGVAVTAGSSVTLNTGQVVTLNADGTIDIAGDGDTENFHFTYTADNGSNSDTGFVTVTSIPCFVAGTLIRTPDGEVPVETLAPGDLVETRDEGPRPLRWTGRRTVAAEGDLAPICIRAGAYGNHRELLVSPQHRVLLRDSWAELLFGDGEVLVAARDLVDGGKVRPRPGGQVTYVHLMFDRHQVIYSEGLETESFLPGPQTTNLFEAPVVDELRRLFPQLDPATGNGYGGAARRTLRNYEARVLLTGRQAA